MTRSNGLFSRFTPYEGWLALIIPWAMLAMVGLIVAEADLALDYPMRFMLLTMGSGGLLAGYALARSKFPSATAHLYSFLYALFMLTWLIGRNMPAEMIWQDRVFELVDMLIEWVQILLNGGTNREVLVWVVYTTATFWILGYSMSWFTFRRRNIWMVILPGGLVALSVIYYYYGPRPLTLYLAAYCLLSLIYVAYTYLVQAQEHWLDEQVRFDSDFGRNVTRVAALAAVLLMAFAWNLRPLSANAAVMDVVSDVNEPWRDLRDNWQRVFAALDSSYSQGVSDAYDTSLALGGPRNTTDTAVMDVRVDEKLPYAYWRAQVLHNYDGRSWSEANGRTSEHFPDDGEIDIVSSQERIPVTQTFINYVPDAGTIYGAPDLVASDAQLFVRGFETPNGDLSVSNTRARFVLQQGETYTIESQLSTADEWSLRRASDNYAPYIEALYLEIPDSTSAETLALAEEITAPYSNPFDKAIAVRNWLRLNITYNDQVDWPPPDVDPVHHVLFDTQEGYCNYYAAAMAVMLRSQGVPTRLARGYAAGEFLEETNTYRVRARDAHTWPEVYFPGYGWIQFEPTTAVSVVSRPEGEGGDLFDGEQPDTSAPEPEETAEPTPEIEELSPDEAQDEFGEGEEAPQTATPGGIPIPAWLDQFKLWQVLSAVGLVGAAIGTVVVADRTNRRIEGSVSGSYGRLSRWGRWLGLDVRPTHTPYEQAAIITDAVPEGERSIRQLTSAFVRQTYTKRKQSSIVNTLNEWQKLRPLLRKKLFERRLPWRRTQ